MTRNWTTLTTEKERLQNKQAQGIHESSVGVLVGFHMLQVCGHIKHVVVLVALHFMSPIQLLSMLQLITFSPVCEFLIDAHSAFIVRNRRGRCYSYRSDRRISFWLNISPRTSTDRYSSCG